LCCDKCDGKHETEQCPYYKKRRDDHPDAQKGSRQKLGGFSLLPGSTIMRAKVVRQPGDGSCLFHSMSYGLGNGLTAPRLRSEICNFIQNNPDLKISDTPLKVEPALPSLPSLIPSLGVACSGLGKVGLWRLSD
jgi:hypothetical protein